MKVRGHRNSTSGTMKVREWYKNAEGHLCTASIFCKAALWEVNHQQVHRRCSSSNDLTIWVTILLQHVKDQQCVSRSWALNILFLQYVDILCVSVVCRGYSNDVDQQSWNHPLHTMINHHVFSVSGLITRLFTLQMMRMNSIFCDGLCNTGGWNCKDSIELNYCSGWPSIITYFFSVIPEQEFGRDTHIIELNAAVKFLYFSLTFCCF